MLETNPYYEVQAVSNSSLGVFNPEQGGSPKKFKMLMDGESNKLETPSLKNGKLVHKYIEDPKVFIVEPEDKPTPAIASWVEDVYASLKEQGKKEFDREEVKLIALSLRDKIGATKDVVKLWDIFLTGYHYLEFLLKAEGSYMLTADESKILEGCKKGIESNYLASDLLFNTGMIGNEAFNELPIYWESEKYTFPFKALLDRVRILHDKKVIQLVDFKTTGKSIGYFKNSFESYRYYRQMAFYMKAIMQHFPELKFKYKIEVYVVACETVFPYECKVYKLTNKYIEKGIEEMYTLLNQIQDCYNTGDWVSFPEEKDGLIILEPDGEITEI
jgi:hypothetical protein